MKTSRETVRERIKKVTLEYALAENDIIAAMLDFAAAACKEQREICANTLEQGEIDGFGYNKILNAPQPQLL